MTSTVELVRAGLPVLLFVFFSLLAYVKVAVVLQVLRRGIGQGVPPLMVTVFLGLSLSALTMLPVVSRSVAQVAAAPDSATSSELWKAGLSPLEQFLMTHTRAADRAQVSALAERAAQKQGATVESSALPVTLAAFLLGELRTAFQLGFVLLLPFLLIDLLVALLLSGLQLHGLPVQTVTLAFKLLLFVVCDGFSLLYRGLLWGAP